MWEKNPVRDDKGYITNEQMTRLFESAHNIRDLMLIYTLVYTGRRISEIVRGTNGYGIRPKDIDYEANNITFSILKKNKRKPQEVLEGVPRSEPIRKSLPVNQKFLLVLKLYIETNNIQEDQFIFDMTRQRAGQLITEIGKLSGVTHIGSKKLHPHHFRHTFAVNFTRVSMATPEDIKELQNILQHSDINMTMEYLRYGHTRGREIIDSLSFDKQLPGANESNP